MIATSVNMSVIMGTASTMKMTMPLKLDYSKTLSWKPSQDDKTDLHKSERPYIQWFDF